MTYSWMITEDLLDNLDYCWDDSGKVGPSGAPPDLITRLEAGEGYPFEMFDGDGELCYRGRIITSTGEMGEETSPAPLFGFGEPNAGCTDIRYPGHPEWDCG